MGLLIGISSSCAQSTLSIGGSSPSLLSRPNRRAAESKVLAACHCRHGHGDVDGTDDDVADGVHHGRRNMLLVGLSVLPLFQLKAIALEGDLSKGWLLSALSISGHFFALKKWNLNFRRSISPPQLSVWVLVL
jgi:hypothetical protein